ncbi:primosomal protein N' (replication factor Y) [Aequitasia blattaphilus]|uniref:Replication restart protein PriA n=1 Tax=Aequitasia blattaphilus TaxID=2949332 RepID=A0ABT1ECQ5_9FIRM|nr:primosomal protein N' [Aequitasia blattaphilus]MCP1102737.1 primosomal protein N' [Aequitasia blattaphilus]MCR8615377.1 primosomal protein N' [Aequitasia blattaphilus]
MYADVIVDITHEKLDKIFQYSIPENLKNNLVIGSKVLIPFGKGNKLIQGYVIGLGEKTSYDPTKIKEIHALSEEGINPSEKLIRLAAWIREEYGGTMIAALKTVLPIKKKEKEKEVKKVTLRVSKEEGVKLLEELLGKNQRARVRVLSLLLDQKEWDHKTLLTKAQVSLEVLRSMEKMGILSMQTTRVYRKVLPEGAVGKQEIHLNEEQEKIMQTFRRDRQESTRKTYLIHGITGSGKTQIYMEMIDEVVKEGKQAILLIPEISLTYQVVGKFQNRFKERVAILNSKLSPGERWDQMERVRQKEVDVMIGPRSALFTPFENLGLIVIDEEHEPTYKSEQVPRYHAREVAIQRAKEEGAGVVLGSATPSLDSYYKAMQGEYSLMQIDKRATKSKLAEVEIVDMTKELKEGNRSILSDRLKELIEDRLEKKEQVMLFLNRRGYAGFISCRACGYVVKCPHCDVSLSYHKKSGKLICHYCGYEQENVHTCPECGSPYIGGFKAGTQQVEELIQKKFPTARVLRMDMDTTRKKHSYEEILKVFDEQKADILIGTQMIVKGHDFPKVTLVGILAADMSLYGNDYRAGERTFQLLTQAAGRAGRGVDGGEVVIQTYSPEHYSIELAAKQDYLGFYKKEMEFRRMLSYPPVENMMAVLMTGSDEEKLMVAAKYLKEFVFLLKNIEKHQVIGPAPPYIGKLKDTYRQVIYIRSESNNELIHIKDKMEEYIDINKGFQELYIQFDFNPLNAF